VDGVSVILSQLESVGAVGNVFEEVENCEEEVSSPIDVVTSRSEILDMCKDVMSRVDATVRSLESIRESVGKIWELVESASDGSNGVGATDKPVVVHTEVASCVESSDAIVSGDAVDYEKVRERVLRQVRGEVVSVTVSKDDDEYVPFVGDVRVSPDGVGIDESTIGTLGTIKPNLVEG